MKQGYLFGEHKRAVRKKKKAKHFHLDKIVKSQFDSVSISNKLRKMVEHSNKLFSYGGFCEMNGAEYSLRFDSGSYLLLFSVTSGKKPKYFVYLSQNDCIDYIYSSCDNSLDSAIESLEEALEKIIE